MKKYLSFIAVALTGLSVAGCMTPQGQPDYTASGALTGAATGAIIGSTTRHPGTGSLVGAAVGAVAGGAIGHGMDQTREAQLARMQQQVPQPSPLSIADIESLSRAKVSDGLIISQIRNSRTIYHLRTADIIGLRKAGVSDKVIDYMINTPSLVQSAPTVTTVPESVAEPVIVAPVPEYYWVNGPWIWLDGRWIWHRGYWRAPFHHDHRRWR